MAYNHTPYTTPDVYDWWEWLDAVAFVWVVVTYEDDADYRQWVDDLY